MEPRYLSIVSDDPVKPPERSSVTAAFAAAAPIFVCPLGCGLVLGPNGMRFVTETSVWNQAALVLGPLCTITIAIAIYFAVRGRAVPVALPLFVSILPWLVATAAGALGFSSTLGSIEIFAASDRAMYFGRAFSELVIGQTIGGTTSALLLAGSALGLAITAHGQRAPGRSWTGIVPGFLAATLVLAPAFVVFVVDWRSSFVPIVAALAGAGACLPAALAIGRDEPRVRSIALGAGAVFAGALAAVPAAAAAHAALTIRWFDVTPLSPEDKHALLAEIVDVLVPLDVLMSGGALVAVVAGGLAGVYGLARARHVRPGLVAGAIGACAAAILAGSLGALAASSVRSALDTLSTPADTSEPDR